MSRVFYVLAWGYAGDHGFSWFAKALNAHPEIFALMAHEGSRPKYLKERSRSERPELNSFTAFLEDMGTTYQAIGDCWSYRPWHFKDIAGQDKFNCPLLFIIRHPYIWLEFYVRWRSSNMRMPNGSTDAIDHEWNIAQHQYFKDLKLKPYKKADIEIWSSFQGMVQLNKHRKDVHQSIRCESLESIVEDQQKFVDIITYLTISRVEYKQELLDLVYQWSDIPFRGEQIIYFNPLNLFDSWPDWKKQAFTKIVEDETLSFYQRIGQYAY